MLPVTVSHEYLSVRLIQCDNEDNALAFSWELDQIPGQIMSACAAFAPFSNKKIVNISLETGFMPIVLKGAIIKPLLKKGTLCAEEYEKFKPIFNLHFISRKIIEKSVATQLTKSSDVNYLTEVFQSADKEFHGGETARKKSLMVSVQMAERMTSERMRNGSTSCSKQNSQTAEEILEWMRYKPKGILK